MSALSDADRIELEQDALVDAAVRRLGYTKCVKVGCVTMLTSTPDGFCTYHRGSPHFRAVRDDMERRKVLLCAYDDRDG